MYKNILDTQFLRFAVVGLASNLLCYLVYLGLSTLGMDPKLAMTILYAVGVAQTFVFNKRWTFRHDGAAAVQFYRYCTVYFLGYLLNLAVLYVLVDLYGFPHQVIQAAMIFLLAALLFLAQKFWVFRPVQRPIGNHEKTLS